MEKQLITILSLGVYNVAAFMFIVRSLRGVKLNEVLAEKDMPNTGGGTASPTTSYSRLVGLVGAMILAAFIWGLGDIVIYTALNDPANVANLLNGVTTFIVGGASLFLPYATNQVREAFSPRSTVSNVGNPTKGEPQ
jgi:hypothetical protein